MATRKKFIGTATGSTKKGERAKSPFKANGAKRSPSEYREDFREANSPRKKFYTLENPRKRAISKHRKVKGITKPVGRVGR